VRCGELMTIGRRIGFVSTRLAGTDGVSLETVKWVNVLNGLGCQSYFFAGETDWPAEYSFVVPEAHFNHPEILALNVDLFDDFQRLPDTSQQTTRLKAHLKEQLYQFLHNCRPDVLIVENALSLPMNIPLGLALTELIAETSIPTIAHHHDFAWERERYAVSAAGDYLRAAFPPTLPRIRHVDFNTPPPDPDDYVADFKAELAIDPAECLILQPTRIVPRKRIEMSIELTRRIALDTCLVITHHAGDEGQAYENYLREYANLMGVKVLFAADRFAPNRGSTSDGKKIYSLRDAYYMADLVSYPSRVEGFGNAFLETIYFRRPIVMSSYDIFKTDIQPKGFEIIAFTDFITDNCVQRAEQVLRDPALADEMCKQNFEIGRRHYSYRTLETRLETVLNERLGYD